jgi:hypothetical protein
VGSSLGRVKLKIIKLGFCCFSDNPEAIRSSTLQAVTMVKVRGFRKSMMMKGIPITHVNKSSTAKVRMNITGNYISVVNFNFRCSWNRIGSVMVSLLASSVVDRGFEPRSGQAKDYQTGILLAFIMCFLNIYKSYKTNTC